MTKSVKRQLEGYDRFKQFLDYKKSLNSKDRQLKKELAELRIKVKENDIKNLVVCVGNKGYFNFN